jgi:hypothetical protein
MAACPPYFFSSLLALLAGFVASTGLVSLTGLRPEQDRVSEPLAGEHCLSRVRGGEAHTRTGPPSVCEVERMPGALACRTSTDP